MAKIWTLLCMVAVVTIAPAAQTPSSTDEQRRGKDLQALFEQYSASGKIQVTYRSIRQLAPHSWDFDLAMKAAADFGPTDDTRINFSPNPFSRDKKKGYEELVTAIRAAQANGPITEELENWLAVAQWRLQALGTVSPPDDFEIHELARYGDVEDMRKLLTAHPELVSLKDDDHEGMTPLHCAIEGGNLDVARLLLRRHAHVDAQTERGVTPLHLATTDSGDSAAALLLLRAGANPNVKSGHVVAERYGVDEYNGGTPLHFAVLNRNKAVVVLLLHHGANQLVRNAAGLTPAECARKLGYTELESLLTRRQGPTRER